MRLASNYAEDKTMKIQDMLRVAQELGDVETEPPEGLWDRIKAGLVMEVPLTKGYVALVDAKDYKRVMQFKWHAKTKKNGHTLFVYAARNVAVGPYKQTTERMHRFILGVQDRKIDVDHEDGNGLNNCRRNLRKATRQQNMRNMKIDKNRGRSQYKGVSRDKSRWKSAIAINGKKQVLGWFIAELDAAMAYDTAARKEFGEFARCNFTKEET